MDTVNDQNSTLMQVTEHEGQDVYIKDHKDVNDTKNEHASSLDNNNNNNNNSSSKNVDNNDIQDDDDTITQVTQEHPLQPTFAYSTDTPDRSEQSLLDAHGSPNISRSPSVVNSPVTKPTDHYDLNATHVKGICNAGDKTETIMLPVSGQLPEWLTTEHYTVGPGTFDIRYTRKIEVDGYLQSATGTFTFGHLFDGLPLVNRFDVNGQQNTVSYRSRLTSHRLIEKIRDHHGYAPCHPAGLFNTHANQTVLIKFMKAASKASKPDGEPCGARILTSIPGVDGRLFCQNMANHIQELDPFDLKPSRVLTWDEVNPAFQGYNSCPNGHYDAKTGEYINFTMEIGYRTTRYHFFSTTEQNTRGSIIATVYNTPTGYVNSFAVTENYIILVIFPMLAHSSAVKYAWNESIMDSFSYYPSEPTLFYVISREKGQVIANYQAPPCFGFNHANAFEDDNGQIFVDIVTYKDDTIAHHLMTDRLRDTTSASPLPMSEVRRYLLHNLNAAQSTFVNNQSYIPSVNSITSSMSSLWNYVRGNSSTGNNGSSSDVGDVEKPLNENGWYQWMPIATFTKLGQDLELPTLHPSYKLKKYTYLYGLGVTSESDISNDMENNRGDNGRPSYWNSIVKLDVNSRTLQAKWNDNGCYPSEAIFVPRVSTDQQQDGSVSKEDDGVLISVVLDVIRQTSFLLFLDASTLNEIARSDLGMMIPLSFGRGSFKRRQ
ncbi:retinal pigment epithelial membrane protein-domain-containing protein [Halteromyces radiatus]|uniref:retinal pigment epithelial membrane protein-domain-containing protein n=1 Tax=Halteromyces radiatus TaxID=101107 RepID=UPI00221F1E39|nr:retinal pigment epithelial membrane protein-domain-containing protein [Halteromyces radiatus]KAI8098951.1 retinal pigment epithelial membrane protein-domain-containing protein [Halteromyces radiatus]